MCYCVCYLLYRAEKLIRNHKNLITKISSHGPKLSSVTGSEEEQDRIKNTLNALATALSCERVERRYVESILLLINCKINRLIIDVIAQNVNG